jgi:hypothetical protein
MALQWLRLICKEVGASRNRSHTSLTKARVKLPVAVVAVPPASSSAFRKMRALWKTSARANSSSFTSALKQIAPRGSSQSAS